MTRKRLLKALRAHNFYFKRKAKKVEMWRERGGTRRLAVPFKKDLSPEQAWLVLYQAGLSKKEIEGWVSDEDS